MTTDLLAALVAALVASVAGVVSLRAERRSATPVADSSRRRYRGPSQGTIVVIACAVGVLGLGRVSWPVAGLLGGGIALAVVGTVADRGRLRPRWRLAAEALAGVIGVAAGLDTGITASGPVNAVLVVAFVVAVIESFRLLDAAPRVAATIAAPAALAIAVVAGFAGNASLAAGSLAPPLAGALAGMLVAGIVARFWLGESGSLFVGFVLAGLVCDLRPDTPAPFSLAVVAPLLAIPLFNAAVVWLARLRRRRPLTQRRPDGLAHRLRARRLSWPAVLVLLGGLQAGLGASAVLADRGDLPLVVPVLACLAVLAGLTLPALRPKGVYRHRAIGLSPPVRIVSVLVVLAAGAAIVPGTVALAFARGDVLGGVALAEQGLAAARVGDVEGARRALTDAEAAMAAAAERLSGPFTSLGLGVPLLGPLLAAGRLLTEAGTELAGSGASAAGSIPSQLVVSRAVVPIEEMRRLQPELAAVTPVLQRARRQAQEVDLAYLLPSLRSDAQRLSGSLARAADDADLALQALDVLPAIFGGEEPRNYFVALQNPAEARGSGGIVGSFAELSVVDGRLDLRRTGRADELNQALDLAGLAPGDVPDYLDRFVGTSRPLVWQDFTFSPNFPSVAETVEALYPRSGGASVDGVVSLDSFALAALLELTGPVEVPEWPEAITANNAVDILVRQQYLRLSEEGFDKLERVDFLDSLIAAVFNRIQAGDLPGPARIVEVLGPMVAQDRLQLHSVRPREQALFERLGADGALPALGGDSLAVVTNNSGGNKIDIFLERSWSYRAQVDPDSGRVEATAVIRLRNRAPAGGLDDYVIGSGAAVESPPGTNRLFLSLYSPLGFEGATLDGAPLGMATIGEAGRNAHSAFISIPPGETADIEVQLAGTLGAGEAYDLVLDPQPGIEAASVDVEVAPTPGWRAQSGDGEETDGTIKWSTILETPRSFAVRFERR